MPVLGTEENIKQKQMLSPFHELTVINEIIMLMKV